MDLHPRGCCWMNLQQGSGEASLGSAFTTTLRSLPSLMANADHSHLCWRLRFLPAGD
jgi:hypothetical protein